MVMKMNHSKKVINKMKTLTIILLLQIMGIILCKAMLWAAVKKWPKEMDKMFSESPFTKEFSIEAVSWCPIFNWVVAIDIARDFIDDFFTFDDADSNQK